MALSLTPEQQQLLASLPHTIGSAMAFAGKSGIFGTGKEMFTNSEALLEGMRLYPNNELIRSILPDPQAADRSAEIAEMRATRDWMQSRIRDKQVNSQEKLVDMAVADASEANNLLMTLDPAVAAEYRQWVLGAAEKVAMASSEGGFLGFGGEQFSEGERKLLDQLKNALGVG